MRREQFMLPALRALVARPRLLELAFRRDPWGNPFAADVIADPYPYIERMWESGPVTYKKRFRRYFVAGYQECQYLANHPDASASANLDTLLDDIRPYSRLAPETKAFFRSWMLVQDGDEHGRLRQLVSRTFTPRSVAAFEPTVTAAVTELLDELDGQNNVEFVQAFNRPLPVRVICTLLGIPEADHAWISDVVAAMSTFFDPLSNFDIERVDRAVSDFRPFVVDLARQRTRQPQDDLITALAQAEEQGDRLTEDELVANVGLLVFAGHDTTTNMLGNALIALAAHPTQRALVREQPDLWPNAIEELLRFDTTVSSISRETRADIDVGDITIPAGSTVNLQLTAANRDPRRWDKPRELVLDRPDPRPLSFGHGVHHCRNPRPGRRTARSNFR